MDGRPQTGGEQPGQIVICKPVEHAQLHVRQRTDGERDAFPHEPRHNTLILEAAHAVVDPLGTEGVEGPDDRRRRPLLARVGHDVEPEPPAAGEHAAKLLRRIASLTRIKPHSEKRIAIRLGLLERLEGLALGQMP